MYALADYMSHYRGSPHFSHLDHPSSAPTTPSPPYPQYAQPLLSNMSQQTMSQSRQPTSYPSPHSYPSPSMSSYAYPPPQQQPPPTQAQVPPQNVEPYRSSPTASHVSLPSLNLPPIRAIDPRNPTAVPAPMGSPLPTAGAPVGAYYGAGVPAQSLPPPQPHMNITSSPHPQGLRYPLPAPEGGRIMSGGRHKKEIKRRTKTGCLTCRKRRIKCDEAHPNCRNCQKSKRDCLGYDPIFKAQSGPAAIQPAPSSVPPLTPTLTTPTSMAGPGGYPAMPQAYTSAGGYGPALSTGASSPGSSVEPYDYTAAIDPALEAAGAASLTAPLSAPPTSYGGGAQVFGQDLKGELDTAGPYASTVVETHNQRGGATPVPAEMASTDPLQFEEEIFKGSMAHMNPPAKRIKIDDLFSVGGRVPPPVPPPSNEPGALPIDPTAMEDIKQVYLSTYAPAMDHFLETTWYTRHGLTRLLGDARVCQLFATLLDRAQVDYAEEDIHLHNVTQSLEMAVIWSLLGLCRSAAAAAAGNVLDDASGAANGSGPELARELGPREAGLTEVVERFNAVESLLCNTILDGNPIGGLAVSAVPPHDVVKARECQFWRLVGNYVTLHDDEASAAKQVDDTLKAMRNLLDTRESRDIIYSMAIVRHMGPRAVEFPAGAPEPFSNDEHDAGNQLLVAKTFIERESGSAANVVFQRLCGMAVRSWEVMMMEP